MRDRLLLPILIPVGVAFTIFLLIMSMGKILLEVEPHISTAIAIVIALLILATCSVIAAVPGITARQMSLAAGVPVAIVLGVGLYLAVRPGPPATQAEQAGAAAPAAATSIQETMVDNKFSNTTITVPANQPITFAAQNNGQAIHNWHLLGVKDASGKDIATPLIQPGQSDTITFTITQPGTYDFQCDVHPTEMKGTLTVVAQSQGASAPPGAPTATGGAAAGSGPGATAAGTTIVATDNKFDKTQITIKAGEQTTVTLQNKGSAIHNWHVLGVKSQDGKDIATNLDPGGQSSSVTFTITQPGTYDFQCDVHPTEMKGKLIVQ